MLRVSAFTNGRRAVNEYDALLLQHVLWQRPEEAERIREWLLQRIVKDRGTQQVQYLLSGLYARACRAQGEAQDCSLLAAEATKLREVRARCKCNRCSCLMMLISGPVQALATQLGAFAGVDSGSLPALRSHLWLAGADTERTAQTLRCARAVRASCLRAK